MTKSVARRIRHFRQMRCFTQKVLAAKAGINLRHFQKIEGGRVKFKSETIAKIAQALEIPELLLTDHIPHACQDHRNARCCLENGVLELLPVGITIMGRNGLIIYTNRARSLITGFSPAEVDGHYYAWDFCKTDEQKEQMKSYVQLIMNKKSLNSSYICDILHRNGNAVKVQAKWRYFLNKKDKVIAILSIVQKYVEKAE